MAKNTIGFSVYLNGKLIEEIKVDRPVFNVGKLSTSTLRLDDVNVSRKHAVIELREDGKWRITDLGSTNGTILRGERIEQAELHDGDRLLIGRTTLVVHVDDSGAEGAASAASYQAPATLSGTAGDAQPTAIAIPAMTEGAPGATVAGTPSALAAKAKPKAAPAGVRGPVSQPLEAWATSRPPAPTTTRGFALPRGAVGHILTMLGAVIFLLGSVVLPWQRFELADLSLTHLELNLAGLLMTVLGGATIAVSAWGLATGHRYASARFNFIASLVVVAWCLLAATQLRWGKHLMQYEDVSLQVGFLVALWGGALMIGGSSTALGSLPRWDESSSFLRLLVSRGNRPLQDLVVYSPRTVDFTNEAKHPDLVADPATLSKLPRFHVTREGDASVALRDTGSRVMLNNRERSAGDFASKAKSRAGDRWTPLQVGDRGSIEVGDTRVLFLFVKPVPGRNATTLTSWTEAAAFGFLVVLAFVAAGLYSVIGWEVEPKRDFREDERRMAKIDLVITEDKPPEEKPREVQVELPDPEKQPPEVALTEEEKVGDQENPEDQQNQGEEEDQKRTSELVDKLNPRNNEPIDLSKLSPTERSEKAREIAQQTALAQAFREDNPLYAQIMQINPDVDSRVNVLAALDGAGSTFVAGAVDPFGGTLSNGGGFPGGMEGGGLPTGGPNGGGPAVAGVFDRPGGPRDLNDVKFNDRPLDPRVEERPPRVSGELDAKTVQQYIRRYLPGIKWCYQDRLQSNRKLGGKLTLAFTILPNGNVMDAHTANSTLGDAALDQCIVAKMSRWRFPSPKDGGVVDVAYPLILKTQ